MAKLIPPTVAYRLSPKKKAHLGRKTYQYNDEEPITLSVCRTGYILDGWPEGKIPRPGNT